jgi:hypothetical protein
MDHGIQQDAAAGDRLNHSRDGQSELLVCISFHWHRGGGPTQHDVPFIQNREADSVRNAAGVLFGRHGAHPAVRRRPAGIRERPVLHTFGVM